MLCVCVCVKYIKQNTYSICGERGPMRVEMNKNASTVRLGYSRAAGVEIIFPRV